MYQHQHYGSGNQFWLVLDALVQFVVILFKTLFDFLFSVYECFVCLYVNVSHACNAGGGQQRVSDPLGLALQTEVSCRVGDGNRTWVFFKSSKCS